MGISVVPLYACSGFSRVRQALQLFQLIALLAKLVEGRLLVCKQLARLTYLSDHAVLQQDDAVDIYSNRLSGLCQDEASC